MTKFKIGDYIKTGNEKCIYLVNGFKSFGYVLEYRLEHIDRLTKEVLGHGYYETHSIDEISDIDTEFIATEKFDKDLEELLNDK